MNARMDTIRRLAESDPYWRGYLDGMTAAHHDNSTAHEYARLSQARIDRNTDTTDYDSEWTRNEVAVNPRSEEYQRLKHLPVDTSMVDTFAVDRERVTAQRLGLPYPARLDVDPR